MKSVISTHIVKLLLFIPHKPRIHLLLLLQILELFLLRLLRLRLLLHMLGWVHWLSTLSVRTSIHLIAIRLRLLIIHLARHRIKLLLVHLWDLLLTNLRFLLLIGHHTIRILGDIILVTRLRHATFRYTRLLIH